MRLIHWLLAGAALLALTDDVASQVQPFPQPGVISGIARSQTYSAISVGLVPAASATDIWCLNGSTRKNVHLKRLLLSGTAGTAITTPVILLLRHALDTGGTPATSLALPVGAPNSPVNAPASATLTAYTANPTVNDASPNYLVAAAVPFLVTTGGAVPTTIYGGTSVDELDQGWFIPRAGTVVQQLCLNLNGVSISSGVLAISAEWAEE